MPFTQRGKMFKAIQTNDLRTVTKLLDGGYNVNDTKMNGTNPLLLAVFGGRTEIAELLIKRGADFTSLVYNEDMTGSTWMSLVHVAAYRGHKDIVKLLLEQDKYDHAFLNKQDGNHNTALHLAAMEGHAEVVRILLDAGFDPQQKGFNGKLPVGFAYQGSHKDVVGMLEAAAKKPAPKTIEAAPLPAAAAPANDDACWSLVTKQSVAHVSTVEAAGYKISDVFNFSSRERIRIVNNLKTKADNVETTSFDDLPDSKQVKEAYAALTRLGGTADPAAAEGRLNKPKHAHPTEKKP